MKTGIYSGISLRDYHAAPGFSKSDLDLVARSPAHYRYSVCEETPAMRLGSAAHACILEPEIWDMRYIRANGRRNNKNKTVDKIELTPAEYDTCIGIRDAVRAHPICQDLFDKGNAEQSAWWLDSETKVLCKCRPDWNRPGALIDLKTTADASPDAFSRSVERYRYHVQAAYALDGWTNAGGVAVDRFIFIAVEKAPPYAIGFYKLSNAAIRQGRQLYKEGLYTITSCLVDDSWPGYSNDIITLSVRCSDEDGDVIIL